MVRPPAREELVTHVGYVAGAWGSALVVLTAYGWWTLRRGRVLTAQVSADQRRWSNPRSDDV